MMDNPNIEAAPAAALIAAFLDAVLPPEGQGWRCMWAKLGQQNKQTFHPTNAELAAQLVKYDALGWDVYFCTASLKEPGNRTRANAHSLRAFRLDADVKPGAYATWQDATLATAHFVGSLGLMPTLVHSGHGIHCYIALDKAIAPAVWLPLAKVLDQKAKAAGLLLDHAVTVDVVRVLRPPWTTNRKGEPWPVKLLTQVSR